jgi:hypothetical protein
VKVYTIRKSHRTGLVTVERQDGKRVEPREGFQFTYGYIGTGPRHLAQQLLIDCLENSYAAASNCSAFAMSFFGPASRQKERIEITQREVLRWLSNRVIAGVRG